MGFGNEAKGSQHQRSKLIHQINLFTDNYSAVRQLGQQTLSVQLMYMFPRLTYNMSNSLWQTNHNLSLSLSLVACSVQIQAVNAIGSSPLSPALLARTRPLPPAPPPLECSAAGPQSLKLKWGENASNTHTRALLADDMVYTLQMEDKNHRWSKHTHTQLHHCFPPLRRGAANCVPVYRDQCQTINKH